jgi:hypothetical protein
MAIFESTPDPSRQQFYFYQVKKIRALTDKVSNSELDSIYEKLLSEDTQGAIRLLPAAMDVDIPDRFWEMNQKVTNN